MLLIDFSLFQVILLSFIETAGSGLDDFYRIYRGNNINGTFSLTNFLDSLKKVQT